MKTLISNGLIIDPSQNYSEQADLIIENGRVLDIGSKGKFSGLKPEETFDANGLWVVPGLVDLHVHFREPGFEGKENVESGSKAAVLGGYTTVCAMPNTKPVNDNAYLTRYMIEKAAQVGLCSVLPIGALTKGSLGKEMSPLSELREAGCIAFSDDGEPIYDAGLMRRALEWCSMFGAVICCHEEDKTLTRGGVMNESALSARLGLPGMPTVAEDVMVARDIELARYTKGKVHICHVSTARSLELVRRAKNDGILVTCEVTPHHLHLTEECVCEYDTNSKMSPPLRSETDVIALRQGLKDGSIDAIASDHAPHELDSKNVEFCKASFGIIGLQTNLPLILDFVRDRTISAVQAVNLLSSGPARSLGIEAGTIKKGSMANITLIDPDFEWSLKAESIVSKSKNTPFIGRIFNGIAKHVFYKGVLKVQNSKLTGN
ncbi:MAG: dihydroorotase [bacterium]|nr:dihydroorotase [bacterium]